LNNYKEFKYLLLGIFISLFLVGFVLFIEADKQSRYYEGEGAYGVDR